MQKSEQSAIPDRVLDVLKTQNIGYLSVLSKKGELYSYPVAMYFSNMRVWFMTPTGAAKFKFIKANPNVSFLVDNKLVTTEACGAMIQGKAKILTIGRTILSILSVGPKMIGFSKKYPGMFTFYARGKGLPDERKLYKYRLIRLDPTKILYWQGYNFGKYIPTVKSDKGKNAPELDEDESGFETIASLLQPVNEKMAGTPAPMVHDWLANFEAASPEGVLDEDERHLLRSFQAEPRSVEDSEIGAAAGVSEEEKKLLLKLKR